ncbi:hypothetical protein F4777DRAFT_560200 [Nemania sp. FL0916]|nr:hypothetical protein F4777DRAFT_560200 [Nemania sp. FL0916]
MAPHAFIDGTEAGPRELLLSPQSELDGSAGDLRTFGVSASKLRPFTYWRYSYSIVTHVIIFLLYTLIFVAYSGSMTRDCTLPKSSIYSPAESSLEFERDAIDGVVKKGIFVGPPSASVDAAWADLLAGSNIRIYSDEMNKLGLDSLALSDGSGYLGSLWVFHELHCINRLRRWIFKDYYYPNQTMDAFDESIGHTQHCLETLRQSVMCHGDIAVQPFEWLISSDGRAIGPTTKSRTLHQCANWDRLSKWALSRRVDLSDRTVLANDLGEVST